MDATHVSTWVYRFFSNCCGITVGQILTEKEEEELISFPQTDPHSWINIKLQLWPLNALNAATIHVQFLFCHIIGVPQTLVQPIPINVFSAITTSLPQSCSVACLYVVLLLLIHHRSSLYFVVFEYRTVLSYSMFHPLYTSLLCWKWLISIFFLVNIFNCQPIWHKWPGPVFALCDCKDLRDWWEIRLCSFRCRCLPKTPVFKRKKIKHQAGYICLAAVYMLKYCLDYHR